MAPRKPAAAAAATVVTPEVVDATTLVVPETSIAKLDSKSGTLAQGQKLAVSIKTQAEYEAAGVWRKDTVKPALAAVDDAFDDNILAWRKGLEAARAKKTKYRAPWEALDAALQRGRDQWRRDEDLRRAAELAAQQRLIEEEAEATLVEQAEALISAGREDEANVILESVGNGTADTAAAVAASSPLPASLARTAPREDGISIAKLKRFRYVNPETYAGVKSEYMIGDTKTIQSLVTKQGKRAETTVGGIVVFEIDSERISG